MKKTVAAVVLAVGAGVVLAGGLLTKKLVADDDHHGFHFQPDSIVLTRSVYLGTADTVTIGENLPPGCAGDANGSTVVAVPTTAGGTTNVTVPCGIASDNGEAPNLNDNHNVWNNSGTDGSFGITSPILLDNLSEDGKWLSTLPVPSDLIVTSFSSKSELSINRSVDEKSVTFVGYHGGPGCGGGPVSTTAPNLIDVSASSTPGVCDPTNAVISSSENMPIIPTAYYRAVAEVDAGGHISLTDGNAYSGDNGRAAMKGANGMYYMAGNDNSGNLSKSQLKTTQIGINLVNSTGAELLVPGVVPPPVPPFIDMLAVFSVTNICEPRPVVNGKPTQICFAADKGGKDNNFRGLTIFNNTLYVSKGSGGNGINTIYQVGNAGTLPTGVGNPITILPGFPTTLASGVDLNGNPATVSFPFGMFFANANTLYVCDEGDGAMVTPGANGNVLDAATLATAGVQKWVLQNGTWVRLYVLQNGLNLGFPYSVLDYPASLNPAAAGCRNMTGRVNGDGTVTIWAITSTVSNNGDQGADPNKLVRVTDLLSATTLPGNESGQVQDAGLGTFRIIRSARAGEVFRGVALAPKDH